MRSILDYIKVFKNIETYKEPRSTALGPRNTYQDGQLVTPSVDGSRPGYAGVYKRKDKPGYSTKWRVMGERGGINVAKWLKSQGIETTYKDKKAADAAYKQFLDANPDKLSDVTKAKWMKEGETLATKYNTLVQNAFDAGDMSKTPQWETFLKKQKLKHAGVGTYQAQRVNLGAVDISPMKRQLADKLIKEASKDLKYKPWMEIQKKISPSKAIDTNTWRVFIDKHNKINGQSAKVKQAFDYLKNNDVPLNIPKNLSKTMAQEGSLLRKAIFGLTGVNTSGIREGLAGLDEATKSQIAFADKGTLWTEGQGRTLTEILDDANYRMEGNISWSSDIKKLAGRPNKNAFDYALRNFNYYGKQGKVGQIQFYYKDDKGMKNPIKWDEIEWDNKGGKKLKPSKVFFVDSTENKKIPTQWTTEKIDADHANWKNKKPTAGLLDELYQAKDVYDNLLNTEVIDPRNPKGAKVKFGKIMKAVYGEGYDNFGNPYAIEHGDTVAKSPWKNLRIAEQRINSALYNITRKKGISEGVRKQIISQLNKQTYNVFDKDVITKITGGQKPVIQSVLGEGKKYNQSVLNEMLQNIAKKNKLNITNAEAGYISRAMLEDFAKLGIKGGKLVRWLQPELEPIFEGLFYQYAKQYKGYDHSLAREELFLPKILAKIAPGLWEKAGFKPFKTGIMEGADPLIEKELYTQTDPREFVYFDGKEFKNPNFGKPTGKIDSKVLQYVDALHEQDRIYEAIGAKEQAKEEAALAETGFDAALLPGDLDAASEDVQDLARSGAYGRVDRTLDPESMASQAYNTAVEKRDALDQRRRKEYLEKYDPSFLEREKKSFDIYVRDRDGNILYEKMTSPYKKRYKEMEKYKDDRKEIFGFMSPKDWEKYQKTFPKYKNIAYEHPELLKFADYVETLESKPEGFDKTYKELFPTPASRYDWDLMGEIARAGGVANMAGGGIVGIRRPHAIPPERQGLRSIMINGKKY